MDIRELRYFVQIAKDHSYTNAAKHLYVSQPALSKIIKKLEVEFEVKLFEVHNNKVYLTDYGKYLYGKAVSLLNDFDSLMNFTNDIKKEKKGNIRIGITPMITALWLVDIIVDFSNLYPQITFDLQEGGSKTIREEVKSGNLDIGICITGREKDELNETVLLRDKFVVCTDTNNPISHKKAVKFSELKSEVLNFYSSSSALYENIELHCIQAGYKPKINFTSSKIEILMQFSAKGKGICIIPRPYAEKFKVKNLILVPLDSDLSWEPCIIINNKIYQSYVAKLFLDYVKQRFNIK